MTITDISVGGSIMSHDINDIMPEATMSMFVDILAKRLSFIEMDNTRQVGIETTYGYFIYLSNVYSTFLYV